MNLFDVLFARKLAHSGEFPPVIKRKTGNPIEITDAAAAPLVKCVTAITGSQDLHGYDKPWPPGAGKNKLPLVLADIKSANTYGTWSGNSYTYNCATYTINTDDDENAISILGAYNGSGVSSELHLTFDLPAGDYILSSGFAENMGVNDTFLQKSGTTIARGNNNAPGTQFTLSETSTVTWYFRIGSATKTCTPMIRLSTVSDSTFAPYSNICSITAYTEGEIEVSDGDGNTTTHTTTYPSAIYRGSEDCVGGTETHDMIVITLDNTTTWYYNSAWNAFYTTRFISSNYPTPRPQGYGSQCICDRFVGVDQAPAQLLQGQFGYCSSNISSGSASFYVSAAGFTDLEDFKSSISDGMQIAFVVNDTTSSVTTTNLPIKSLSGYNHIESSTGDMTIDYITDAYQNFVDTVESALPNTRKGGTKALDIFMTLDEPGVDEPEKEVDETVDEKEEVKK